MSNDEIEMTKIETQSKPTHEDFQLTKISARPNFEKWDLFKRFMFMWNDGIGFFSTLADHKLPRILGAKAGWLD